jgi:hypothetical protein
MERLDDARKIRQNGLLRTQEVILFLTIFIVDTDRVVSTGELIVGEGGGWKELSLTLGVFQWPCDGTNSDNRLEWESISPLQ